MRSIVAISSASRTGSYSGTSAALTVAAICVVAPSIAAAMVSGECMNPSSVSWCSDSATAAKPRVSAQRVMSSACRYCSAWVSELAGGMRRSKRRTNTPGPRSISRPYRMDAGLLARPRGEGDREVSHGVHAAAVLEALDAVPLHLEVGDAGEHGLEHGRQHQPGVMRTEAAVRPEPERHVPVVRAEDVDLLRVGERLRVAIGGPVHHQHLLALVHLLAVELDVLGDPAVQAAAGAGDAEELLDDLRHLVDVVDHLLTQCRVAVDQQQRVAGGARRGVHAAEQHEEREVRAARSR